MRVGEQVAEQLPQLPAPDDPRLGRALSGRELSLTCRVRDRAVRHVLEQLDPAVSWGRGAELAVTYGDCSGQGRVESVNVETR